jgi:hypothetical protein
MAKKDNTMKIVAIVGTMVAIGAIGYYLYATSPQGMMNRAQNTMDAFRGYMTAGRPTGQIIYEESNGPLYYLQPQ